MKYKAGFEFEINVGNAYSEFGFELPTGTTASILAISTSVKKPYIIEDGYGTFKAPVSEEELELLVAHQIFPSKKDKITHWLVLLSKSYYGGEEHEVIQCEDKEEVKRVIAEQRHNYPAEGILVFPPLTNMIASELYKEGL